MFDLSGDSRLQHGNPIATPTRLIYLSLGLEGRP
jgi:hypothetical protein